MDQTSQLKNFDTAVHRLTGKYAAFWQEIPDSAPVFSRYFSPRQQRDNERRVDMHLKRFPTSLGPNEVPSRFSMDVIKSIVGSTLLSQDVLNDRYFEKSEKATKRFVKEAREFDPGLSENDVHQALRNLWVFNSIQSICGGDIEVTPSSFAYSLLYPVTDNGLDSSDRTSAEKHAYVEWLSRWFQQGPCRPIDEWTGTTAELLQMIEQEYPRQEFCDVYLSLRAIHEAQRKSLSLQNIPAGYNEESLTAITIEKGGTSVLVDGFLAAGRLNIEQADSFFEYGVLLQLVDDLRDVDEDRINGHSTPFLRMAEINKLDSATRRLLFFAKHCAEKLSRLDKHHATQVREMVDQSCSFLILEAAARHRELYSKRFLQKAERCMPLRSSFLGELHERIKTRQSPQTTLLGLAHS
ncbi:MAG: hypothetical protein WBZ48_13140 [Bacteroidota bacterium]